jgi:hypothetical protein
MPSKSWNVGRDAAQTNQHGAVTEIVVSHVVNVGITENQTTAEL